MKHSLEHKMNIDKITVRSQTNSKCGAYPVGAGIVFIFLAGISNIFWVLGAVAIVVGAFFFIRWVANGNG